MQAYERADLRVGMTEFSATITAAMLDAFCGLSGDSNPLHVDNEFARASGFDAAVAHGLLTASLYSRLVGMHLPGKNSLLQEIKVSFVNPAYVGDVLAVSAVVSHRNEAYRQLEIKARINPDGSRRG